MFQESPNFPQYRYDLFFQPFDTFGVCQPSLLVQVVG